MFKQTIHLRNFAKSARASPKVQTPPVPKRKPSGIPLITCKRPEFNVYKHEAIPADAKFGTIPLASSGWQHYRSKNDFFILHPSVELFNSTSENSELSKPFSMFELNETLVENLQSEFDVARATYVQHKALPLILSGIHTLIAAETGCGKTIAYLVPIITEILRQKKEEVGGGEKRPFNTPRAVVLTPGRELAIQIGEVAEKLSRNLGIRVNVVVGGSTKQKMLHPTFEEVDILVGSIGATSKLVTNRIYRVNDVKQVVLDEADTMFDDTFSGKLEHFMQKFGFHENIANESTEEGGAQLILASATLPENTYDLLQLFIDPESIQEVVSPNLHRLLPQIHQKFMRMRKISRPLEMLNIIKPELERKRPVIIFGNKSVTSDYISLFLNDNGVKAVSLNGDLLNKIREGQFAKFQNGEVNVLATTDVASRGLDTKRACHIINFDFPLHVSDYIHRIGRIGRLGSDNNGTVTNFITGLNEVHLVRKIEHAVRTRGTFRDVNNNFTRKPQPVHEEPVPKDNSDVMF